jgi:hypothetical protein
LHRLWCLVWHQNIQLQIPFQDALPQWWPHQE